MIGCTTRWIALPCRVSSIVTESTRNGMSSMTISTTRVRRLPSRAPRRPGCRRAPSARPGGARARAASARAPRRRRRARCGRRGRPVPRSRSTRARTLDVVRLVALKPFADARDRPLEQCRLRFSRARGHRTLAFQYDPRRATSARPVDSLDGRALRRRRDPRRRLRARTAVPRAREHRRPARSRRSGQVRRALLRRRRREEDRPAGAVPEARVPRAAQGDRGLPRPERVLLRAR